jgi:hypothetical protein
MAVEEGSVGNLMITKYNATKIREAIAKMITKDELPFLYHLLNSPNGIYLTKQILKLLEYPLEQVRASWSGKNALLRGSQSPHPIVRSIKDCKVPKYSCGFSKTSCYPCQSNRYVLNKIALKIEWHNL